MDVITRNTVHRMGSPRGSMSKQGDFAKFPLWVQTHLQEWIKEDNSVNVFVAGKTGTGKSALVNSLVGKEVSAEGNSLNPVTTQICEYMCKLDDTCINVWDSPGLQDGYGRENEYLRGIVRLSKKIDLFIYCICMFERMFVYSNGDIITMRLLSESLGLGIWKNALIVLTFANIVVDNGKDKGLAGLALEEYFQQKVENWKKCLRTVLVEQIHIPKEVVDHIKIVPAGHYKRLQLLHEGECWMSRLWLKALAACSSRAQPAFIRINEHRLKNVDLDGPGLARQKSVQSDFLHERSLILAAKGEEIGKALGCPKGMGYKAGLEFGEKSNMDFAMQLSLFAFKNKVIDSCLQNDPDTKDQYELSSSKHSPAVVTSIGISRCATCGKHSEKLQKCGGCKKVAYCDQTCQEIDWKEHKKVCSASVDQLQLKTCSACEKKFRTLQSCDCHKVAYCSKECQRMDWYRHKTECTATKDNCSIL